MLGVINRQATTTREASLALAPRLRGAAAATCLALGCLPGFAATGALAGDRLAVGGVALTPIVIQPGAATDIRRAVELNGDQPLATYVTASSRSGETLARTRQGYWLPWTGREEDLSDAGFTAKSGLLEFKLAKEDFAAAALPITVSIGYRTAAGIKFGSFEIRAK
ncbi:MAG: hypothetical protein IT563_01035 [Alphaproteobacteria bacterium]|nr:hypothetical protein [Alphaproteobacteria bacterium]